MLPYMLSYGLYFAFSIVQILVPAIAVALLITGREEKLRDWLTEYLHLPGKWVSKINPTIVLLLWVFSLQFNLHYLIPGVLPDQIVCVNRDKESPSKLARYHFGLVHSPATPFASATYRFVAPGEARDLVVEPYGIMKANDGDAFDCHGKPLYFWKLILHTR